MDANHPHAAAGGPPPPQALQNRPTYLEGFLFFLNLLSIYLSFVPMVLSTWLSVRAKKAHYTPDLRNTLYFVTAASWWGCWITAGTCATVWATYAEKNSPRDASKRSEIRGLMFVPYFGWIVQGAAAIALTSVFGFGLSCPKEDAITHCKQLLALQALLWACWVGFTAFIISEALTVYLDKAIDEKQRQKEAVDRGIPGGQEPPIRMEAMAARGAGGV